MNCFKDIESNIVKSNITISEAIKKFKDEQIYILAVEEEEEIIGELHILDFCDIFKLEDYSKPITPYIRKVSHENMGIKEFSGLIEYYKGMTDNVHEVIESVPSGILIIDKDGEIITINRAAEKIMNIKRENFLNKHISNFDKTEALYKVIETGQDTWNVKRTVNGATIRVSRAVLRRDGKILGAVAVFEDISGIEKLTKELKVTKDSLENIESIIESSYDGIMITDGKGKVQMVNSSWEQMCGMTREEVMGKRAGEMVEKGFWSNSSVEKALETKKTSTVMLEMDLW